jgi:hypothetical protein
MKTKRSARARATVRLAEAPTDNTYAILCLILERTRLRCREISDRCQEVLESEPPPPIARAARNSEPPSAA